MKLETLHGLLQTSYAKSTGISGSIVHIYIYTHVYRNGNAGVLSSTVRHLVEPTTDAIWIVGASCSRYQVFVLKEPDLVDTPVMLAAWGKSVAMCLGAAVVQGTWTS